MENFAGPSYLTPKAAGRTTDNRGGKTAFAVAPIKKGDVVGVFGGDVLTTAQLQALPRSQWKWAIQIADDHYLFSKIDSPADWINHSCEPNLGFSGQIVLVALRDIEPEEELSFDYAMCDSAPYDEFICECGAPTCRGLVTHLDWQLPQLQERYGDFFTPHVMRLIKEQISQTA